MSVLALGFATVGAVASEAPAYSPWAAWAHAPGSPVSVNLYTGHLGGAVEDIHLPQKGALSLSVGRAIVDDQWVAGPLVDLGVYVVDVGGSTVINGEIPALPSLTVLNQEGVPEEFRLPDDPQNETIETCEHLADLSTEYTSILMSANYSVATVTYRLRYNPCEVPNPGTEPVSTVQYVIDRLEIQDTEGVTRILDRDNFPILEVWVSDLFDDGGLHMVMDTSAGTAWIDDSYGRRILYTGLVDSDPNDFFPTETCVDLDRDDNCEVGEPQIRYTYSIEEIEGSDPRYLLVETTRDEGTGSDASETWRFSYEGDRLTEMTFPDGEGRVRVFRGGSLGAVSEVDLCPSADGAEPCVVRWYETQSGPDGLSCGIEYYRDPDGSGFTMFEQVFSPNGDLKRELRALNLDLGEVSPHLDDPFSEDPLHDWEFVGDSRDGMLSFSQVYLLNDSSWPYPYISKRVTTTTYGPDQLRNGEQAYQVVTTSEYDPLGQVVKRLVEPTVLDGGEAVAGAGTTATLTQYEYLTSALPRDPGSEGPPRFLHRMTRKTIQYALESESGGGSGQSFGDPYELVAQGFDSNTGMLLWRRHDGLWYPDAVYSYHDDGTLERVVDSYGHSTGFDDYQYGAPGSVHNDAGATATYERRWDGQPIKKIDFNGNRWGYDHDALGRLTTINPPAGPWTTITYIGHSQVNVQRGLEWSQTFYDGLHRVTFERTGLGSWQDIDNATILLRRDYTYNSVNGIASIEYRETADALAAPAQVVDFDRNGRKLNVRWFAGQSAPYRVTTYVYDDPGRSLEVLTCGPDPGASSAPDSCSEAGSVLEREYRRWESVGDTVRLREVQQNDAALIRYEYDDVFEGRLASVLVFGNASGSEPVASLHRTYDANGLLSSEWDPARGWTKHFVESTNNPAYPSFTFLAATGTEDSSGLILYHWTEPVAAGTGYWRTGVSTGWPATASNTVLSYRSDSEGWLVEAVNNADEVSVSYVRDAIGRVVTKITDLGSTTYRTSVYYDDGPDGSGWPRAVGYPFKGLVVQRSYYDGREPLHSAGTMKDLSWTWPNVLHRQRRRSTFGWTRGGRFSSVVLPNGVTESFSYDAAWRVSSVHVDSMGHDILLMHLSYNDLDQVSTKSWDGGRSLTFAYDALRRTTTMAVDDGVTHTFSYDVPGNRQVVDGTLKYTYDEVSDPVLSSGILLARDLKSIAGTTSSSTYTWTENGKIASLSRDGVSASAVYDELGKLVSLGDESFRYDAEGHIVERTLGDGTTIHDVVGPFGKLIGRETVAPDGSITRTAFINAPVPGLRLASISDDGSELFWSFDQQGTTIMLSGIDGSPVWSAAGGAIDPFGVRAGADDRALFQGAEWDPDLQLYIMGARLYDPFSGRFLAPDPILDITNSQDFGLYTGMWNQPMNIVDPLGLKEKQDEKKNNEIGVIDEEELERQMELLEELLEQAAAEEQHKRDVQEFLREINPYNYGYQDPFRCLCAMVATASVLDGPFIGGNIAAGLTALGVGLVGSAAAIAAKGESPLEVAAQFYSGCTIVLKEPSSGSSSSGSSQ